MRKWLSIVVLPSLVFGVLWLAPGSAVAGSASTAEACAAIGGTWSAGECKTTGPSVEGIVATVVNIMSIIVGVAAVIMIIWGGFKYITAGGDSGQLSTARNTIIYAVIGLAIAGLAQFLVQFVLNQVVGVEAEVE